MAQNPTVFISQLLHGRILQKFDQALSSGTQGSRSTTLIQIFSSWVATGGHDLVIPPNKIFGRHVPPTVDGKSHHVHMVPTDALLKATWDQKYENWLKDPTLKVPTSDRYLIFASDREKNLHLIIQHLNPDAHLIWEGDKSKARSYDAIAQKFHALQHEMPGIVSYDLAYSQEQYVLKKYTPANENLKEQKAKA